MPEIKWEFTPQFAVSMLQFVVVFVAVLGIWFRLQYDVAAAKQTVSDLRAIIAESLKAQNLATERLTRVETQMQSIIPTLNRIEERQVRTTP